MSHKFSVSVGTRYTVISKIKSSKWKITTKDEDDKSVTLSEGSNLLNLADIGGLDLSGLGWEIMFNFKLY